MALESTIMCAVRGCQNNGQALRTWLGRVCYEHWPTLNAECSCPPLYDFHKLPVGAVDRQMWLKALQLKQVSQNIYVCSVHFADKRPTDAHPYPEINMGVMKNPEDNIPAGNSSEKPKTSVVTAKKKRRDPTIKYLSVQRKSMETPTTPSSDSGLSEEHKCELCGTCFETRRGLSSHARCHLRQLGVSVSDSSGAPIELLYRLIEERDGQLPKPAPQPNPLKRHKGLPLVKREGQVQGPALKIKISNLVRKKYSIFSQASTARKSSAAAAIASRLSSPPVPQSATLRRFGSSASTASFPLSTLHVKDAGPSAEKSPLVTASAKPQWAPQASDAPLNLMTVDPAGRDDVHVCELCGAWFETRKGLSSHARAHLRTFGIDTAEAKGAPIDTLHQFMISKGLKPGSATMQASSVKQEESTLAISAKRPAPPSPSPKASSSSPSAKRFKSSSSSAEGLPLPESLQKDDESAKSDGESARDIVCEFCGELFMRSQSLSSHARSHLRQLGITEWSVQGSPMATLREVMAQRGVTSILKLPSSSPSQALPSARSPLKIPPPPPSPLRVPSPLKPSASAPLKLPKARKGSRFVNKAKDEPTEVDVSEVVATPGPSRSGTPQSPFRSDLSSANTQSPMRAPKPELDVNQPVECDYCNDTFDSRKALSCHARAHLRQLGVRWPAQASPIDALHELMQREGAVRATEVKREPSPGPGPSPSPGKRQSASPVAFTLPPPGEPAPKGPKASSSEAFDATCELCGFDFENRKALASHARAHLRQQGVDWRLNGSPIETLSAWMQKEPGKVAELHKRYMMGDLPNIRKRSSSSPCPSSDSEAAHGGGHRASSLLRSSQGSSRASGSKGDKSHGNQGSAGAHSELNVRQPREQHTTCRRPPKHQSHADNRVRENKPPKPSRSGNVPSLVPRPPDTPLVRQVGKVYSLKCRFCDKEFRGPLSVQEDWVRHLQEHILNLKKDGSATAPTSPLPPATPAPPIHLTPQPV
ncbi:protein Wiz isoform X2 [Alosa sapidissima]|uniref:protein Wiz isoform X2 n=1 Tax=Alosa sapidissima TaxID=34773 RepID=UPI001C083B36|nr:protein Wiz isoform X2 [Alosa sapidissima]